MKHEQITLVVLGYVIGFVTAFIGFELTDDDMNSKVKTTHESGEYGLVVNASQEEHMNNTSSDAAVITDTVVDNRGLFVIINGEERIVSAAGVPGDGDPNGYHYAISEVAIAPDGSALYFCVQHDPSAAQCTNYVYNASTDMTYLVKDTNTGTYLDAEISSLNASWSEDAKLVINEWRSTSADTPWLVE